MRNHVFIARLSIISFVHQNFQMRRIQSWLQTIEYRLHNYCLNAPIVFCLTPFPSILLPQSHTPLSKFQKSIWFNQMTKSLLKMYHLNTFINILPKPYRIRQNQIAPIFRIFKMGLHCRRTRNTQVENQMPSCLIVYIKIFFWIHKNTAALSAKANDSTNFKAFF